MLRTDAVPGLQGFSLSRFLDQTSRSLNTYAPLVNAAGNATGISTGFVSDAQQFLNQLLPQQPPQAPPQPQQQRPGIIGQPIPGAAYASIRRQVQGGGTPVWLLPALIGGGVLVLALVLRR